MNKVADQRWIHRVDEPPICNCSLGYPSLKSWWRNHSFVCAVDTDFWLKSVIFAMKSCKMESIWMLLWCTTSVGFALVSSQL
ncbi:hypothetical protein ACH5RR_034137 [Cinchona calisaya]|uniref:Uncharacterized protein n=1 Tax=Cinchona calisaya TaxID=153742 RepID=A0ABD2YC73_9GENT